MSTKKSEIIEELLAELKKTSQRTWYKTDTVWVYAEPKCPYCDENRVIHAVAANGQELESDCKCSKQKKEVWTVTPVEIDTFVITDINKVIEILPSKTHTNGEIVRSWWADPSPDENPSEAMLYNSLFSSMEKFKEYCEKAGIAIMTEDMTEEGY